MENDEGVRNEHTTNAEKSAEDNAILLLSELKIDEDSPEKVIALRQIQMEGSSTLSESCHAEQTTTPNDISVSSFSWRSLLSKVEVWYASYGSNMWKPRFLCYIEGGKVCSHFHEKPSVFPYFAGKNVLTKSQLQRSAQ